MRKLRHSGRRLRSSNCCPSEAPQSNHQTGFSLSTGLLEPQKPQRGHELTINGEAGVAGIAE